MIYAIFALVSGVFYREFTKLNDFTGKTALSVTHLHLYALGMLFFLIVALLVKSTRVEQEKPFKVFLRLYNIALPFMVFMYYVRGITQVLELDLSRALDASISGIAGLSHILMAVSIYFFYKSLRRVADS